MSERTLPLALKVTGSAAISIVVKGNVFVPRVDADLAEVLVGAGMDANAYASPSNWRGELIGESKGDVTLGTRGASLGNPGMHLLQTCCVAGVAKGILERCDILASVLVDRPIRLLGDDVEIMPLWKAGTGIAVGVFFSIFDGSGNF